MWVFVIAAQNTEILRSILPDIENFFEPQWPEIVARYPETSKHDILAIKNTLLMFKSFNKERIREARICSEGFDHIFKHYA